jgi:uncharacterized protein YcnI
MLGSTLPYRWRLRATLVTAAVGVLGLLATGTASAHVTVHADDPTSGASDVAVTFRTPNEMDNASTTKLDVFFPTATPLLGVLVQPHPGWTGKSTLTKLATPVKTDDGTITEAVSEVVWTADTAADGLQPGQSGDFVVTAGQLPDAKSLTFKALQTYSNGKIVRWIEVQAAGAAEPDNPAPTLDLAAAAPDPGASTAPSSSAPASAATTGSGSAASPSSATVAAAQPAKSSTSDTTARVLGIVGIAVGVLGTGAGVVLGRRRQGA